MEKCEEAVAAEITSAAAATESSAVRGAAACAASPQSGSMTARQWLALAGLTCSAFVFNTSEFMPIGLLSSIAGGFGLTEAQAGMMTSIYAWAVMALSLPLMVLGSRLNPRLLLLAVIAVFLAGQVGSALAPSFALLVAARLLVAAAHAVFWSIATPLATRIADERHASVAMGMVVTGSDMSASVSTQELENQGIPVAIGHHAENIAGADCIIRTAAAHNDNPEIAAARAAGIPVFERAQAWGEIMKSYKNAICISGTHGKTTTTSMMTHILMEANLDPTVMIGGYLPLLHAGHRVGHGDTILLESCEYCDSFLNFFPTLAVILNVEADHLDYFKDLEDIQKSFHQFASLATFGVIANGDDPHTVSAMQGIDYVSFGLGEQNRIHAANMHPDWQHFDVICDGEYYCHLDMGVLGKHNALNALAAAAAAWMMGIPGEAVSHGLESFHGAGRRMEFKGKFQGADVYDDYAHHPDELSATVSAVRSAIPGRRIVLAFQPHTYTRTKALFDDFVRELKKPDVVILSEIYAARERNAIGISSLDLAKQIPGAVYCETLPEVTDQLREIVREGDVVITMGAGDIFRAGEALLEK